MCSNIYQPAQLLLAWCQILFCLFKLFQSLIINESCIYHFCELYDKFCLFFISSSIFFVRVFQCLLLCVVSILPLKDQRDNKIKNDVTGGGGSGVTTISDKKWHRAEGVHVNSDITVKNKENMFKFLFFAYFWSAREQLSFGRHSSGGVVSSIDLSPRAQAK